MSRRGYCDSHDRCGKGEDNVTDMIDAVWEAAA